MPELFKRHSKNLNPEVEGIETIAVSEVLISYEPNPNGWVAHFPFALQPR